MFRQHPRLQFSLFTQHVLEQKGADKEDPLEPSTRDEERLQVGGADVTEVHGVLVARHERVDRAPLGAPARQHRDKHPPPHDTGDEGYEVPVDQGKVEVPQVALHGVSFGVRSPVNASKAAGVAFFVRLYLWRCWQVLRDVITAMAGAKGGGGRDSCLYQKKKATVAGRGAQVKRRGLGDRTLRSRFSVRKWLVP